MRTRLIILCLVGLVMPGILLDRQLCGASDTTTKPSATSATKASTSPASMPSTNPASEPAENPNWKVVKAYDSGFILVVPKDWPQLKLPGTMGFSFKGDGLGVPAADQSGSPIQVSMMVDRTNDESPDPPAVTAKKDQQKTVAMTQVAGPAWQRDRPRVISSDPIQKLKLSDGTEAAFTRTLLVKEGSRRSLQLKMFAKDKKSRGVVVSATITTGMDTDFISKNKDLERKLKAHMITLCFDMEKLDTAALDKLYASKPSRPAGGSTAKPVKTPKPAIP